MIPSIYWEEKTFALLPIGGCAIRHLFLTYVFWKSFLLHWVRASVICRGFGQWDGCWFKHLCLITTMRLPFVIKPKKRAACRKVSGYGETQWRRRDCGTFIGGKSESRFSHWI
jgi:hypothetical protein